MQTAMTRANGPGDRLLNEVAAAWGGAVRITDLLARHGGEAGGRDRHVTAAVPA
jgi:hypothetical protein